LEVKNSILIVGLGKTGLSCVKHFSQKGVSIAVADSREAPPGLSELQANFPDIKVSLGGFDEQLFSHAKQIILSPGISLKEPTIAKQIERGVPVFGDIEIFAQENKSPVIAITGSNGKSTVTALVGEMAKNAGIKVAVGGNIGTPVLDLLEQRADLYVLELSSFQLETTHSLKPKVAAILNVSMDHMDRYENISEYVAAKKRIYQNASFVIFNRDDQNTFYSGQEKQNSFGHDEPKENAPKINELALRKTEEGTFLAYGNKNLLNVSELKIKGKHNWLNALAALAIGKAAGFDTESMLKTLREFKGLPHRCQWVANKNNVDFYNDSKATNVGATVAAIEGLSAEAKGKIVLIAGGQGKNADFSDLKEPVQKYVRSVILFGQDADVIAEAVEEHPSDVGAQHPFIRFVNLLKKMWPSMARQLFSFNQLPRLAALLRSRRSLSGRSLREPAPVQKNENFEVIVLRAKDLSEAIELASSHSHEGDAILFSPACASFDMFRNYEHRGEEFIKVVAKQS